MIFFVYQAQTKCEQPPECGPRRMPHSCTNLIHFG